MITMVRCGPAGRRGPTTIERRPDVTGADILAGRGLAAEPGADTGTEAPRASASRSLSQEGT
jgi:hypothetical protein